MTPPTAQVALEAVERLQRGALTLSVFPLDVGPQDVDDLNTAKAFIEHAAAEGEARGWVARSLGMPEPNATVVAFEKSTGYIAGTVELLFDESEPRWCVEADDGTRWRLEGFEFWFALPKLPSPPEKGSK